MSDKDYLQWPFFDDKHRQLEAELDAWAAKHIPHGHGPDVDAECRALVKSLGQAGWLRHAVGGTANGGAGETIDTRAICLIRETLARHSGLADFAFAMQGLGSGAISLHGTPEQRERYLTKVARGEAISAFALSEPEATDGHPDEHAADHVHHEAVRQSDERTGHGHESGHPQQDGLAIRLPR